MQPRNLTRYLFTILGVFISCTARSQDLIANGRFEDVNICSERNAPCSPSAWTSALDYAGWGYPQALLGINESRCVYCLVKDTQKPEQRMYWQTELVYPMEAGIRYHISFWVQPYNTEFYGNLVQVALGREKLHLKGLQPAGITPTIAVTVNDTRGRVKKGWIHFSLDYQARGGEKWMVLGNFFPDSVGQGQAQKASNKNGQVLYLLDNISVTPGKNAQKPDAQTYAASLKAIYNDRARHEGLEKTDTVIITTAAPLPISDTLSFSDVLFHVNSYELQPMFIDSLQQVLPALAAPSVRQIIVNGHTDNSGSEALNATLSLNRANAIAGFLKDNGIAAGRISTNGFGNTQPVAGNDTEEGKRKNRRVEIIIIRK